MPAYQPVSFTSPGYDYSADIAAIDRRRAMAQALQQQGMQPIDQQPVAPGQFAVPISPWQSAAKLAQVYGGIRQQNKADTQQRELAARSQSDLDQIMNKARAAMFGKPATPLQEDASGNITPAQPAVPGDPSAAASIYMRDPRTAQLGMQMMQQQLEAERRRRAMADYMGKSGAGGPWSPEYAGRQAQGGNALAGIPPQALAMMLDEDKAIAGIGKMLAEQGNTSGRVYYDQNNKAYTVDKSGRRIDIGGTEQGISPADRMRIPLEQSRLWWETGQRPPPLGTPAQTAAGQPPSIPGATTPAPVATAPGPQVQPGMPLPPKEKAKLELARPEQTQAAVTTLNTSQNLLNELTRLEQQPGLSRITGPYAGRASQYGLNLTGESANAQANLDTLKAQIGVETLNAMRQASKTGGAVGQVTEKEWPILQNQLGALQQSQTTAEFKKNLSAIKETVQRIQSTSRKAYEDIYGKLDWTPQTRTPSPLSDKERAELEALRAKHGRR